MMEWEDFTAFARNFRHDTITASFLNSERRNDASRSRVSFRSTASLFIDLFATFY